MADADGTKPKRKRKGRKSGKRGKRGAKRGTAKRTAKRGTKRGTAKRTAKRGGGKLAARVTKLEKRVDGHSKQLRHHASFINALVNGARKAMGRGAMKDPIAGTAARALGGK